MYLFLKGCKITLKKNKIGIKTEKKTIQEMSTVLEASGTTSHILAFAL